MGLLMGVFQVIPFNFNERKVAPEILDAMKIKDDMYFIVKWSNNAEGLEVIAATEMYVEYPMYVFKFYEKCIVWVESDQA